MDEVLDFIARRFPHDNNWLNGNCYYFATILKARFPEGEIWYELIDDHFVFLFNHIFYDWSGIVDHYKETQDSLIKWNEYKNIDSLHYSRIVRDVIL